jgi:ribose transport system permease protein
MSTPIGHPEALDAAGVAPPAMSHRSSRPRPRLDPFASLERFGLLILFAVVIIVFSALRPHTFATVANWRSIGISQSVLAVAALAFVIPLIGGRFDVSIGSNLALSAVAAAAAMGNHSWPLVPAVLFGIAVGTCVGLVNGYLVAYLGVNSIIGTLGMTSVLGGLVTAYTQGVPIDNNLSSTLTDLSIKKTLGVPDLVILMLLIAVAVWFVLTQTPFGRYLAGVGSNLNAATLTGLPVKRIILFSFAGGGALAGAAGVLQIASQGNADPSVGSISFVLPALAAAFLGATTWRPGRYNVPGTIIAVFFLGTTVSGLALVGAAPWVTDVFNGAAVIIAIAVSAQLRRRRTGAIEVGQ